MVNNVLSARVRDLRLRKEGPRSGALELSMAAKSWLFPGDHGSDGRFRGMLVSDSRDHWTSSKLILLIEVPVQGLQCPGSVHIG